LTLALIAVPPIVFWEILLKYEYMPSRQICKMNLSYVNGKKMLVNKKNKLDQYFTKRYIAEKLFEKTKNIVSQYEKIEKYT